jgi:hypothetical protein
LGNNDPLSDSPVPVLVTSSAGVTFTQLSAGGYHSLAVGSNGDAYAWGDNSEGQLGNDGAPTDSSVPVVVERSVVVTGVTFDGVAGTGLTQSAGSWSIDAPAHKSGAVDVVISYTQFGSAKTQMTANGFTYLATLAATGSSAPFLVVGLALLLVIAGGGLLVARRIAAQRVF